MPSRSSGWALAANVSPISLPPVKRRQPSFTKVTSPSASVIHMSAGVVSARSLKRASLSLMRSSWLARFTAASRSPATSSR